ncbi:uncharacterized protein V6R79_024415 [Siganus canaliculatus]
MDLVAAGDTERNETRSEVSGAAQLFLTSPEELMGGQTKRGEVRAAPAFSEQTLESAEYGGILKRPLLSHQERMQQTLDPSSNTSPPLSPADVGRLNGGLSARRLQTFPTEVSVCQQSAV